MMSDSFHHDMEPWLHALRWVMTRPQMITDLPGGPTPLMKGDDPRLDALIAHTRDHWPALSRTLPRYKLGLAFEALVVWGMTHGLGWDILGRNVQIFEQKRTIGALDLVVRDDLGEVTHWELAYKLYLQCDAATGWSSWLGPVGRDRLSIKLPHMLEHQLPLSLRSEARASLERLAISQIDQRRTLLQGTLFTHWRGSIARPDHGEMAAEGRWLRWSEVSELVTLYPHWRWVHRAKPLWFGYAASAEDAVSGEALIQHDEVERALLFSRFDGDDEQLFFVVPADWGQLQRDETPRPR